jgi:NADH dehydrogenase FAD-containing subunit
MTEATDRPSPLHPRLLLLGASPAHLQVLATLAQKAQPGVQVTLVSPFSHYLDLALLPGFVAGQHALDDCRIALAPLVEKAGARWLQQPVRAFNAHDRSVQLDDGRALSYDWLSVTAEPVQDREQMDRAMPGVRENGLFLHPVERFASLWPRVTELAEDRALRLAVIGNNAAALELAMAMRERLRQSAVTLITGGDLVAAHYAPGMQRRVVAALKAHNITVLADAAVRIEAGEIHLGQGARLACDVPVMASDAQMPAWLASSGLALDAHGAIAVDGCQRSVSHAMVFAPDPEHGGAALSLNLAAVMSGLPARTRAPAPSTRRLLSCGKQQAIAGWGNFSAQGYWVWLWKNWIDRARVRRHLKT